MYREALTHDEAYLPAAANLGCALLVRGVRAAGGMSNRRPPGEREPPQRAAQAEKPHADAWYEAERITSGPPLVLQPLGSEPGICHTKS